LVLPSVAPLSGIPLVAWRAKQTTREQAVAEIARRYREFVNIFEMSGHPT
jgi:hypothetical protein